ncbi:MAG: hypothetical protein PHU86_03785 [Patescibacteria group bacterium]|nr:hypothetical protein [Patescibacteria group bacterium]
MKNEIQYKEVSVNVNGQTILTISSQHLSGIENIDEYKDVIIDLADSLLMFVGTDKNMLDAYVTLRPSVQRFAQEMERKLKLNDHKGGWMKMTPTEILSDLAKERLELGQALAIGDSENILEECADNANYLMMLAEVSASK